MENGPWDWWKWIEGLGKEVEREGELHTSGIRQEQLDLLTPVDITGVNHDVQVECTEYSCGTWQQLSTMKFIFIYLLSGVFPIKGLV